MNQILSLSLSLCFFVCLSFFLKFISPLVLFPFSAMCDYYFTIHFIYIHDILSALPLFPYLSLQIKL